MFLTAVDQHFQSTSASPPFQTLQRFLLPVKSKNGRRRAAPLLFLTTSFHLILPIPFTQGRESFVEFVKKKHNEISFF